MKQGEAPRVDRVGAITQGNAIKQPGVKLGVSLCFLFSELGGLRDGLSRSSPFKELHPGSWCWSAAAFQGLASGVPP